MLQTSKKRKKSFFSMFLSVIMFSSFLTGTIATVNAAGGTTITYQFEGEDANKPGYAQGKVTLKAETSGTYHLYWADDTKALDGYYEISTMNLNSNSSGNTSFDYHTAIPANATKIIAVKDTSNLYVSNAVAVYNLPQNKLLSAGSGELLYKFSSYSDVHIDIRGNSSYYKDANKTWSNALQYAYEKDTDFIVSSGDMINHYSSSTEKDWDNYLKTLANSNYCNPVWEANGNHDLKQSVSGGIKDFMKATGTDNTTVNYDKNLPYYYTTEKSSGDMFIFMALESSSNPSECDEFSKAQLDWVEKLLSENYNKGINIYLIQHSPIDRYGAGDRMSKPYYKAMLSESYESTRRFKSILEKYKNIIWMSGHTHADFELGYNYSNENGKSCNMIHNSAVVGSTVPDSSDSSFDYNNGYGKNSQGYYVETYKNSVVFYGANLTDKKIYPKNTYIMSGSRNNNEETPTSPTTPIPDTKRVYFSNDLNWNSVYCYSWSDTDTTSCTWCGYSATYYDNIDGMKIYYCDIPTNHTYIIWNDSNWQTVDISLDGKNDFFIPSTTISSKAVTVNAEEIKNYIHQDETIYYAGDVNFDEKIDISDVTLLQEYIAHMINDNQFSYESKILADVNDDGQINILDATDIQKYIVNKLDKFKSDHTISKICDNVLLNDIETANDNAVLDKLDFNAELITSEKMLKQLYKMSSYDQYQALKKFVVTYRKSVFVNDIQSAATELKNLENQLLTISEHIGYKFNPQQTEKVYYFENTKNWSQVYCYSWTGSESNGSWPGVKLNKVGTNSNHDVYEVKTPYENVIFTDGSNQTVDIKLSDYSQNAFYINNSTNKYTVGTFNYGGTTTDTKTYVLCYYNSTAHNWTDFDTTFTKQSDGTYKLEYTTKNNENISLNVYEKSSSTYNCVPTSESFEYQDGISLNYQLTKSSARGSSITIKNLTAGKKINFVYNPTTNTLNISTSTSSIVDPPSTNSYILYYVPTSSQANSNNTFYANVKYSTGTYQKYTFEKTNEIYNGVSVYKTVITEPEVTDILKIQYQTYNSANEWVSQIVSEETTTLSYYNGKTMVASSTTSGSLITR